MADEAVELVREAFTAAARVTDPSGRRLDALDPETREAVFDFFHPEIELREDPRFPEGGVYRGIDAVRRYFDQFVQSFGEFVFDAPELVALATDTVLLEFRIRMRGRESGAVMEVNPGWIYTLRDGKVVRLEAYLDREQARAAAGLSD
jgi:ketosteroid isomerase-like protein